jgi:putative transposase
LKHHCHQPDPPGEALRGQPTSHRQPDTSPGIRVIKTYKVELDPNAKQQEALLRHAGTARFIWNWALARRQEIYAKTKKGPSFIDQNNELTAIKNEHFPWMNEIASRVREGALRDLDKAFKAFFRRLKAGEKPGYPKPRTRRKGIGGFWTYGARVTGTHVSVPLIPGIKLKERGRLPVGTHKGGRITERAGRWFISIPVETDIAAPENDGSPIGIDVGINALAVTSDGETFDAPKPLKANLKKLRRLSRAHGRRQKGGANRRKSAQRLARLHYRIACIRQDALHRITTHLAKNHGLIAIEDLNVQGMARNRHLSRAILDMGWYEFRRQLEYKCLWYGSKLVVVPAPYTSRTCSDCGHIKTDLALSERVFRCEACGMVLDRDLNAARNILVAAKPAETLNAWGGTEGKAGPENQESLRRPLAVGA